MSERTGRAWRSAAPTMVAVAVIVAVWAAVARLMGNPTLLPSPLEVLRTFGHLIRSGAIFVNSGTSLGRIVLMAGAVTLALLIRQSGKEVGAGAMYCPEYEALVEPRGDRCLAVGDGRCVSSIWSCQRSCRGEVRPTA